MIHSHQHLLERFVTADLNCIAERSSSIDEDEEKLIEEVESYIKLYPGLQMPKELMELKPGWYFGR